MDIQEIGYGVPNIYLAQFRDSKCAVVYTVRTFAFQKMGEIIDWLRNCYICWKECAPRS